MQINIDITEEDELYALKAVTDRLNSVRPETDKLTPRQVIKQLVGNALEDWVRQNPMPNTAGIKTALAELAAQKAGLTGADLAEVEAAEAALISIRAKAVAKQTLPT